MEISHDGQYLFAVNTASGSISSYSIAVGGSLWVVDPTADAVSGFAVNRGRLTELPTSPTPAPIGAAPAGIGVTGDSSPGKPNHR